MDPIIKILVLTSLAFVTTIAWTPALTHVLYKYRLGKQIRLGADAPVYAALHAHKAGTPTMGGILIWATALAFAALFAFADAFAIPWLRHLHFLSRAETFLPLGALVAAAIVGFGDDLLNVFRIGPGGGGFRVRHRLLLYAVIAFVVAWWFVGKLEWTTTRVPFVGPVDLGMWGFFAFASFILIATVHAVNLTDGLDGLAGGTLLTAYAAYGAIAIVEERYDLAALIGVLIGATLAFLWFNIPPARFFMGDTGATSLGIALGVIALLTNAPLLLPIIGLPFVVEAGSALLQMTSKRLRHGKKIFRSAPLHHHLEAMGWPEAKIVMRFWVISAVTAVLGLVVFLMDRGTW